MLDLVSDVTWTVTKSEHKQGGEARAGSENISIIRDETGFRLCINSREKITRRMVSDDAGMRSERVNFLNNEFLNEFWTNFWISNEFEELLKEIKWFFEFKKIPKNLLNLVNFANNCEIFEYIC